MDGSIPVIVANHTHTHKHIARRRRNRKRTHVIANRARLLDYQGPLVLLHRQPGPFGDIILNSATGNFVKAISIGQVVVGNYWRQ